MIKTRWLAIGALLLLFACGDEETSIDPPLITISGEWGVADLTVSGLPGDQFTALITVASLNGINTVTVDKDSGEFDPMFPVTLFTKTAGAPGPESTSPLEFSYTLRTDEIDSAVSLVITAVEDTEEEQSNTQRLTVITNEPPIEAFTAILLGGFDNLFVGSSYDAIEDSVFLANNLRGVFNADNQARIDLVYYYDDTSLATLASPDSDDAEAAWLAQNPVTSTWPFGTEENTTIFMDVISEFDFDDDIDNPGLAEIIDDTNGLSEVTELSVGDVYAFQTDDSRGARIGVFRVVNVSGVSDGSIELEVKIQIRDNTP